jgi:hypothetical protein
MRFLATLFLAASACVQGFTIPDGQADGVYEVSYENDIETHTFLRGLESTDSASGISSRVSNRPSAKRQIGPGGTNSLGKPPSSSLKVKD